MAYQIRLLTVDDAPAAYRLGAIAFGYPDHPMPSPAEQKPGRHNWGAFTDDGQLIAKAVDREQSHWFGGRLVPATGVAGVAVAPEQRGGGISTALMTHLMAGARERGAAIGALFNTTPWPYRRVGWEEVGVLRTTSMPTNALAGLRTPEGFSVRAATARDVPAMLAMFRRVAMAGCAIMDRSAPIVDPDPAAVLAEFHGTSVAIDPDGAIAGFCSWDRAGGYRAGGTLTVEDLIALNPLALTALFAMIGGWSSVAPKLILNLPPDDPAFLVGALSHALEQSRDPWMLRVIDASAAVAARGWNDCVSGAIDLAIDDPTCPWNTGRHRLVIDGGTGRLEPAGSGSGSGSGSSTVAVGPRGLAVLYAGGSSPDVLRRAGLLSGGDHQTDAFLQAAAAGPVPTLKDYF